eukprot:4197538-Amphidinium_carterae.1
MPSKSSRFHYRSFSRTYQAVVTEDGSQWNFSDLVDDLRVVRKKRKNGGRRPRCERYFSHPGWQRRSRGANG